MNAWNGARGAPAGPAARRKRIIALFGYMVVLTGLLAGCAGISPGRTSSSAPPNRLSASTTEPQPSAGAAAVMTSPGKVSSLGRSRYNDIYGGLRVHDRGAASTLDVYLVEFSSSAQSDLGSAAKPLPVVFLKAAQSQASLEALNARLGGARSLLSKAGVEVGDSWTQGPPGRLYVDVVHLKAGDREKIATAIHSDAFELASIPGLYGDSPGHDATAKRPVRG